MTTQQETRRVLVVLPRLADGRIILLHRLGKASDDGLWELPTCPLPAGGTVSEVAADLLHTTIDYVPERLARLGTSSEVHAFLADGLRPSPLPPRHDGQVMTTAVHLSELRAMIDLGLVRCPTLLSVLEQLPSAEQERDC